MSTIEKILAGMFFLIGVYLVIQSKGGLNTVISKLSDQVSMITMSLQGR